MRGIRGVLVVHVEAEGHVEGSFPHLEDGSDGRYFFDFEVESRSCVVVIVCVVCVCRVVVIRGRFQSHIVMIVVVALASTTDDDFGRFGNGFVHDLVAFRPWPDFVF
jgi:hypothetical protein